MNGLAQRKKKGEMISGLLCSSCTDRVLSVHIVSGISGVPDVAI